MKIIEYRDASNRLTVEVNDIPAWKYPWLKWRIRKAFNLKEKSKAVATLNDKAQEFSCKTGEVSIDWDIWSGFTVTSLNNQSESLVKTYRSI